MKHATSRILFAYWDTLRGDRAAPERGDIEPGAIRQIIADTFILGVEPTGPATFRLAGTRCSAVLGSDLKGSSFARLWRERDRPDVEGAVEAVVSDSCGIVFGAMASSDLGQDLALELVLLPLRHRGRTHARVLGCLSPVSVPTWIGLAPLSSLETRSLRVLDAKRETPRPAGPALAALDLASLAPGRAAPGSAAPGLSAPGLSAPGLAALDRRRNFIVHEGGRDAF